MDYELRPATENDYEFCHKLTKQNMHDLFTRHWGGWIDSEFRKGFIADNTQIILSRNRQIGYLSHKFVEDSVYIDNIQITAKCQGQGLGTMVLKDFLARYQDAVIRLTTFEDNPAKHLYERLAFEVYEKNGFTIKMEKQPANAAGEF
jgi:ribosomal protein S18 acetylase RimI-like enzyme